MNLKQIALVATGVVLLASSVVAIAHDWKKSNEEPTPGMIEKLKAARENLIAARNKDN